jgi:hypothetical protein
MREPQVDYSNIASAMKIARPMNSNCLVDMIHAQWIQNKK